MNRFKPTILGAVAAALVLTTTTAVAGSGVGGVFNIGQVNTVDAQTSLNGNPGGSPLLKVTSTGTAAAVRGVAGTGIGTNGVSTSGVGQQGLSDSGIGTLGTHGNTTGVSPGVQGETNSTDPAGAGVVGKNNGGGPGLKAIVTTGAPPLAVNSQVKVTNLNADLLDGLDSPAFQKRVTGICAAGSAVKAVNTDGTVACEPVGGGGVWSLNGNSGTTGANFLGTTDNQPLELKVNGQRALRLEPTAGPVNVIGGDAGNTVGPGVVGAVIGGGGGGSIGTNNSVTGGLGTVGGGWQNSAGGSATVAGGQGNLAAGDYSAIGGGFENGTSAASATVGGGNSNTADGQTSVVAGGSSNHANSPDSTIGGGDNNVVSGDHAAISGGTYNVASGRSSFAVGQNNTAGGYASVVAGDVNQASGDWSVVAGGEQNVASGAYAAIPMGFGNTASGEMSFAAGNEAKATELGSFVWSDFSLLTGLTSPGPNTFTVRAKGGIWLGTNSSPSITTGHFIDTSTGAYLSGSGTWTSVSDRAKKHNVRRLDKRSVLEKVAQMPITSWSYKAEKPSVRHIGPMAQDFYKAFGLGLDNKHITTIDEGGVALAAIQSLYKQNQALERRVMLLEQQLRVREGRRER